MMIMILCDCLYARHGAGEPEAIIILIRWTYFIVAYQNVLILGRLPGLETCWC